MAIPQVLNQEAYVSVSIPSELIVEVDKFVDVSYMGHKTRAEFIKSAIRRFIEDIKKDCIDTNSKKTAEVEA